MKPDYDPIELYWRDDDPDAHWHDDPTPRTVKRTVAFLGAVLVLAVVMAFAVGGEG